jgi:[protein-PII] uridylyltransferase
LSYIEYELKDHLVKNVPLAEPTRARLSRQLKHFPIAPEADVRAHDREGFHVLSIVAGDRPGLLYAIAYVFVRHGISLHTAKINTLGDRAEDSFIVSGGALDDPAARQVFANDLLEQLST